MATITATAPWNAPAAATTTTNRLLDKWNRFMESQGPNKTFWFVTSLVVQGVLLLPVPAVLIYYFDAPVAVLAVTLTLFFANVIAGMGGAGIKTLLWLFASSVLIHLVMVTLSVLIYQFR